MSDTHDEHVHHDGILAAKVHQQLEDQQLEDQLNGTLNLEKDGGPAVYKNDPSALAHPLFGTTIYIGRNMIDTIYGPFEVLTFQDLIHKGYILALVKGDLKKNDVVYTRLHSSCVTSETLGSLDCDCIQQLNGALELISQKPCGVLFYLIQEGRGCGYVGKSRDRMLVQHHKDSITTFEAYNRMGMEKDYRNYCNIKDVCHILAVKPSFVLLTNNPDKIKGLRSQGMDIVGVESIEVPPNPWNQQYLISKQQSGHILIHVKEKIQSYTMPTEPCEPFAPYSLPEAPRFVHVASYFLPIKPSKALITQAEYDELNLNLTYDLTLDGELLLDIRDHVSLLEKYHFLRRPYWFKVHVYYDIQTSSDLVVLEYKDCRNPKRPPLVRIHSESIFSRFPLRASSYKRKYHNSIESIIKHGVGMVVLMYHDGRGFGLGSYIIDSQTKASKSSSNLVIQRRSSFVDENVEKSLVRSEGRDFAGASILLRRHSNNHAFIMMYSNDISRIAYEKHFPRIHDWMWVGDVDDKFGHQLLNERNRRIATLLAAPNNSIKILDPKAPKAASYNVAGIGSSEAHARFLVEKLRKLNITAKFVPIATSVAEIPADEKLIVFSQGMSPHTLSYVRRADVVFTAVTEENKDQSKVTLLKEVIARGGNIVWFPLEDEYDVLIRFVGPFFGFVAVMHWIGDTSEIPKGSDVVQWSLRTPPFEFSKKTVESKRLSLLLPSSIVPYHQNLLNKWIEGVFFSPPFVNDYLSFIHGSFQSIACTPDQSTPHILFSTGVEPFDAVSEVLGSSHPIWKVDITHGIFEIEMLMNNWLLQLMNRVRTNQRDWPGKDRDRILYSSRYN